MARAKTTKLYRTFTKGLITEAGFLTYPEDASTDELNTVIYRKGNRSRRLGIDFEPDSTAINVPGYTADSITTEYVWLAADNHAATNFLCMQIANIIYFFDLSETPTAAGLKSFTIDLEDYKSPTATVNQVRGANVHMAAGKGFLFIAQEFIEPLSVEYDLDTDTISVITVLIQVRDFDGVSDGLANDEEPTTLSKEHHYNLRNQGWVSPGTRATGTLPGGVTVGNPTFFDPHTGGTFEYSPGDPNNLHEAIP